MDEDREGREREGRLLGVGFGRTATASGPALRSGATTQNLDLPRGQTRPLRERIAAKMEWREAAGERAVMLRIPRLGRVKLSAVFYRRSLGVADEDNDRARLKPILDGLVRARVIPKDTRTFVQWGEVREERGPTGFALVIEAV